MSRTAGFRLQLLSGAALATICAAPALAQDAEATTAAAVGLEQIIVTATKRATNLQDTPIAINVMSAESIQDRHVQSLYDLADGAVPSLRIATFEARQSALTVGIRGIVPLDANQPAREQGVGIYIDGVYLGRQHGLNAALFDVERIEVLKGPQGTLFGRNTEGGALSIVTKAPSGEFQVRSTAGVANFGGYNGDIHLDLPTFANVSLKLDGVVQRQGAVTKNPLAGQAGWGYFDRRGLRAAARWTPSEDVTADFAYDVGYDANTPFYSQLLNFNPNGCVAGPVAAGSTCVLPGTNFTALTGTVKPVPSIVVIEGREQMKDADIGVPQQPSIDKTHGFTANLAWQMSPTVELRSITAYREVKTFQWDNAGGAHRPPVYTPGGAFSRYSLADLWQNQFSQELQAVGAFGKFEYAAGLYYFQERVRDDAATPSTNTWNATGTGYTINDPANQQFGRRSVDRASRAYARSKAVFGQATWSPVETLHFTLGGRGTWDDKDGFLYIVNNIARPYSYAQKTSRFNPMAVVAWDPAENVHLYAKYATGYRSGGASSRSITYREFGPEDVKSYELGAKTEFWDRRARLNLAAYMMDRKGSQIDFSSVSFDSITNSSRNTVETVNAPGTTKIKGFEADFSVNPLAGLTLTASYAYTDTHIPAVANPFTNIVQNVYVVFTPKNAASGAIDYVMAAGSASLKFHADGNYAQATQTFDQYATKNDPSFIVNAKISLTDIKLRDMGGMLTVSAWSRNLFNEAHVYRRDPSNSLPAFGAGAVGNINNVMGDYGNFNAPRTFGMEVTVRY